jgi:uncharacterized membrane protein
MGNLLSSLSKTVHSSLVLAILLFLGLFFANGGFEFDRYFWSWLFRLAHVVVATMWIGLLWYFNFVQIPNMSKIPDEQKPAIGKVIAPAALFYFRVWFIIWPNQKRALGIVECEPDVKAGSARTAMLFSRTNTLLSLPMLLTMVAAQNLY